MMEPHKFDRKDRVRETLKREVTDILYREVKDPRLGFLTVTDVEMSVDMRYATVFVSVYGTRRQQEETLQGLSSAAKYVRREIGRRIRLRHTPEVRFALDLSAARAEKLNRLFSRLHLAPTHSSG